MADTVNIGELDTSDEMIAERRSDHTNLPDDMEPWMRKAIIFIDSLSLWSGRIVCLLLIPMMFSMVYEIFMRKMFIAPTLWAYDISRMACGAMFMLGAAYGLMRGVHIRADFLYRLASDRWQAIMDTALYILFYFPSLFFFLFISYEYAFKAWSRGELSMDTAWMAPVGPIKSAIPIGCLLLIIQGVSELLKCHYAIQKNRWP